MLVLLTSLLLALPLCQGAIPVIFDTDVGTDFDDSAAIAFAVQNPDVDVKLILTATGDTTARAQIVAKFLTEINRTDIPIGIGLPTQLPAGPLFGWGADFPLSKYAGNVYADGVAAAANIIQANMAAGLTTQIIAIAPCNNFPSLLSRFPDVVRGSVVKAMSGSIHYGYMNSTQPAAEYNVRICPSCTRAVYEAAWPVYITPLDTCGTVRLTNSDYDTLLAGSSNVARTLTQSLLYWGKHLPGDIMQGTTIWYDAVAAYMAAGSASLLQYSPIRVRVTDDGFTVEDPAGSAIQAALQWAPGGEAGFETLLATVLARPSPARAA